MRTITMSALPWAQCVTGCESRADVRGFAERRRRRRYVRFRVELPAICRAARLDVHELSFLDYRTLVEEWVALNP